MADVEEEVKERRLSACEQTGRGRGVRFEVEGVDGVPWFSTEKRLVNKTGVITEGT